MENPDGKVMCRDVLDYIPKILHKTVSDGYLFMARYAPWAWGWFYWSSDRPSLQSGCFDKIHDAICAGYVPKMEADLYAADVEAVYFTHYFAAANIAASNRDKFPVYYVNTDFVSHRFQRNKIFASSFVASPVALKQHTDDGIENVADTGIPIAPKYADIPSRSRARELLGFDCGDKIVMVSGGGIGAGSVKDAAESLASRKELKTIVICGSNKLLFSRLTKKYAGAENIRIVGFVPDMENYYAAADIGIMKPGGLSLSEAMAARLPLFLMDPIPGQEQLNMDYVCRLGAAMPLLQPHKAAESALALLNDEVRLGSVQKEIEKIARPDAAGEILRKGGFLPK